MTLFSISPKNCLQNSSDLLQFLYRQEKCLKIAAKARKILTPILKMRAENVGILYRNGSKKTQSGGFLQEFSKKTISPFCQQAFFLKLIMRRSYDIWANLYKKTVGTHFRFFFLIFLISGCVPKTTHSVEVEKWASDFFWLILGKMLLKLQILKEWWNKSKIRFWHLFLHGFYSINLEGFGQILLGWLRTTWRWNVVAKKKRRYGSFL